MPYTLTLSKKQKQIALDHGASMDGRRVIFQESYKISEMITTLTVTSHTKSSGELRAYRALISKLESMRADSDTFFQPEVEAQAPVPSIIPTERVQVKSTAGQRKVIEALTIDGIYFDGTGKRADMVIRKGDLDSVIASLQAEYRYKTGGDRRAISTVLCKLGASAVAGGTENFDHRTFDDKGHGIIEFIAKSCSVTYKRSTGFTNRKDVTTTIQFLRGLSKVGLAPQLCLKLCGQLEAVRERLPVDYAALTSVIEDYNVKHGIGKSVKQADPAPVVEVEEPVMTTKIIEIEPTQADITDGPSEADLAEAAAFEAELEADLEAELAAELDQAPEQAPEDDGELAPEPFETISMDEYKEEGDEDQICQYCGDEVDICDCYEEGGYSEDDCCVVVTLASFLSYFGRAKLDEAGAAWTEEGGIQVAYFNKEQAEAFLDTIESWIYWDNRLMAHENADMAEPLWAEINTFKRYLDID